MRFDLHLRASFREQVRELAQQMDAWEVLPRIDDDERRRLTQRVGAFPHLLEAEGLRIGGVDGSGDFPSLAYCDTFVYVTCAQATAYAADTTCGLREIAPPQPPVVHPTWLPEDDAKRPVTLDDAFACLAGESVRGTVELSDYRQLKAKLAGRAETVDELVEGLIRPHAWDAANIGLQLRSTAELGAALRMIRLSDDLNCMLLDTTLSLPFAMRRTDSLFFEHLKRLCCVEALGKGVAFLALSKSHGLPSIDGIEEIVRTVTAVPAEATPEHWFVRIPTAPVDGWELSLASGRLLPPPGAMTYLLRFHRNTPVMRLDMDIEYWRTFIEGSSSAETADREAALLGRLDYACHDQRCYGYPYPIKAAHDRVSLTKPERLALRKLIVDEAVAAGMRRSMFRDPAEATGHE